jgi:hypothetical protein
MNQDHLNEDERPGPGRNQPSTSPTTNLGTHGLSFLLGGWCPTSSGRYRTLILPVKTRPQGGGMSRVDDRAMFTAIVFVCSSGCAWRPLPPSFGVTVPTAHRPVHRRDPSRHVAAAAPTVLDELGSRGLSDWSRGPGCTRVRTKKGPTGRSGPGGSRQARLEDPRAVRPRRTALAVDFSAADTNNNQALKPLVMAIPAVRSLVRVKLRVQYKPKMNQCCRQPLSR